MSATRLRRPTAHCGTCTTSRSANNSPIDWWIQLIAYDEIFTPDFLPAGVKFGS